MKKTYFGLDFLFNHKVKAGVFKTVSYGIANDSFFLGFMLNKSRHLTNMGKENDRT